MSATQLLLVDCAAVADYGRALAVLGLPGALWYGEEEDVPGALQASGLRQLCTDS